MPLPFLPIIFSFRYQFSIVNFQLTCPTFPWPSFAPFRVIRGRTRLSAFLQSPWPTARCLGSIPHVIGFPWSTAHGLAYPSPADGDFPIAPFADYQALALENRTFVELLWNYSGAYLVPFNPLWALFWNPFDPWEPTSKPFRRRL